jgi:RNA 2',3'-cyclic 3'-phosphodiesterase
MPRLFTGIELPDETRETLKRLRTPLPGARWIEPENLHVTLRFAGDIDNSMAREFAIALEDIDCDAFEMRIAGLGTFGSSNPRTLWAGVEAGPQLDALARANERAARTAGLDPEKRGFKAHVTLARFQHAQAEAVARFLSRNGGLRCPPFFVDRFALFSARPKTGGGPYVIEEEFPLHGFGPGAWNEHETVL